MTEYTALWPLQVAVDTALGADADLATALGRPYALAAFDGIAPENTLYPFIAFGDGAESQAPLFSSRGTLAFLTLDLWCAEAAGKAGVLALYREIARILGGTTPLAVSGYVPSSVAIKLRRVTQDATRAWHASVEVTARARAV